MVYSIYFKAKHGTQTMLFDPNISRFISVDGPHQFFLDYWDSVNTNVTLWMIDISLNEQVMKAQFALWLFYEYYPNENAVFLASL